MCVPLIGDSEITLQPYRMMNSVNRAFLTGVAVTEPQYFIKDGIGHTSFTLVTEENFANGITHKEVHNVLMTSLPKKQVIKVIIGTTYHIEGKIVSTKTVDASGRNEYQIAIKVSAIHLA